MLKNAHGTLEYARVHDDKLILRGWLVDQNGAFEQINVRCGTTELPAAERILRPDLAEVITTIPHCELAGFM